MVGRKLENLAKCSLTVVVNSSIVKGDGKRWIVSLFSPCMHRG